MKTIVLQAPRRFLPTYTKKISVPEHCRELTPHQFHTIGRLSREELDAEHFVPEFYDISMDLWNKLPPFYHYTLTDLVRSISSVHSISFFIDRQVDVDLYVRFLPETSVMPLYQFMNADTFASLYEMTKKEKYLILFFCQLALPEDADYFQHSSSILQNHIETNINDSPSLRSLLLDTYLNWQLIKSFLSDKFPNMFPSGEPSADGEPSRPSAWYDVFDSLIGEHLENIETYKRLPAFDVFRIIDSRIRDKKFKQ